MWIVLDDNISSLRNQDQGLSQVGLGACQAIATLNTANFNFGAPQSNEH